MQGGILAYIIKNSYQIERGDNQRGKREKREKKAVTGLVLSGMGNAAERAQKDKTGIYCLNLNLKNSSVDASNNVRKLAAITGMSFTANPYTSHMATPRQKIENIPSERSLAERLFHVFTTCGRNAAVVNDPAIKPQT